MALIDYGQVPSIEPDFENSRLISRKDVRSQCNEFKYIDNRFLNSPNKGYDGFSLVGKHKGTGKWRILRVWGYW